MHDAVVVCGGGAAGLAAALAAARGGADVLLLEHSQAVGGTVAQALIHTLGGLYDASGEIQNGGLPQELIQRLQQADPRTGQRRMGRTWVLSVCPQTYRETVTRWIAEQPGAAVCCGTQVQRVARKGSRIAQLEVATSDGSTSVWPRAVIDATGTAEVARLLDPSLVIDDGPRSAGGWICRVGNVACGALDFPKGLAIVRDLRAAAVTGELPRLCHHAWLDSGIDGDEAFVKLVVPVGKNWRPEETELSRQAAAACAAIVHFLRQRPDFARAEIRQTGSLGVRDGGRIRGRYTLTVDDVRQGRRFSGSAGRCSWPIEYWDPELGVSVEYLRDGVAYDIPMSALQVPGVDNFWAVGKCLSADRRAHASARVVGACWAMGQAAGSAAAALGAHQEQPHDSQHGSVVPPDRPQAAGTSGDARPAAGSGALVPQAG